MSIRQHVLSLDGSVQSLLEALADPSITGPDNVPCRQITFQAGPSNVDPIYMGDAFVSTALWAWRIPPPSANMPPFTLGPFDTGPLKLAYFYVIGTNGETLHLGLVPY